MEYYPENHHKKPKAVPLAADDMTEEQKQTAQALQKQLNAELEELKTQIDGFQIKTEPMILERTIIEEHIASIRNTISIDEMYTVHLQDQLDDLRLQEERFQNI